MGWLTFIKRTPRLLKLALLVVILSAGFKLGLAYADSIYTVSGTVTLDGNPIPSPSGDQVGLSSTSGDGAGGSSPLSNGSYSIGDLPNDSYGGSVQRLALQ